MYEIYLTKEKEIDYPRTEWRLLEAGIDKVIRNYLENSNIENKNLIDEYDNLTKLGILEIKKDLASDLGKEDLAKEFKQEINKEIENLEQKI
ncbi:TroA family protein [Oceanivirga miroungae]|uniref:hypothetical protein n=1 Tax=Oceanivirga miroungae TaxID=1130046 RepID=UPI0012E991AD|nr:hypothetical protein [Oceanivirga miroungae]